MNSLKNLYDLSEKRNEKKEKNTEKKLTESQMIKNILLKIDEGYHVKFSSIKPRNIHGN